MHRRSLSLFTLLLIVSATPLFASQFEPVSFDRVAREARFVVRANVVDTWAAWDDAHEVIYTYATLRVSRYFGETTGPDTLLVREVGGTVDGYTQEAIGFPAIRRGENVVLFLSQWQDSGDMRIHAYNQGKYLVRMRERDRAEVLISDPEQQGDQRLSPGRRLEADAVAEEAGITIEEFSDMVDAARADEGHPRAARRQ
jgi:hypothetical protein